MTNIGTTSSLEVHHQQHRSQSGDDSARNLITLWAACHKNVHRGAWRSYGRREGWDSAFLLWGYSSIAENLTALGSAEGSIGTHLLVSRIGRWGFVG